MKPFRCQICGETYLGDFAPDRCPYCGVAGNYLLSAPEYIEYGAVELGEESREFCRIAMETEMSNVAFYRCASKKAASPVASALFKKIGKQELEHLELIAKMAGVELPAIAEEECSEDDAENMGKAHDREARAIKLYTGFAQKAPEGRMKEVFRALSDVEQEHFKLFNLYR